MQHFTTIEHIRHGSSKIYFADELPGLNFAFHCGRPVEVEYPFLFRCPQIETGLENANRVVKMLQSHWAVLVEMDFCKVLSEPEFWPITSGNCSWVELIPALKH